MHADLNRRATDIFPIRIHIERMFGLHPHPAGLEVFPLPHAQMMAAAHAGEQAKEAKRSDGSDDADIEQAIVHFGLRRDFHPAAETRSIGESSDEGGLIAADSP